MKNSKLKKRALPSLCVWFAMGLNFALAQDVILPVDPVVFTPASDQQVTISIFQNGRDVTEFWLPKPYESVEIRVNHVSSAKIRLVSPGPNDPIKGQQLKTSAYPGTCTNYGDENGADFEFNEENRILTPKDSGGMAVVEVSGTDVIGSSFNNFYIIPADSDFDGIADIYEKRYCTQNSGTGLTCLEAADDNEIFPDNAVSPRDGISARDEYRGFRVSGEYIRTDPRIKDLFINLVTEKASQGQVNLNTFFGDDLVPFFANMDLFCTDLRVHRIFSDEWIDHFESYSYPKVTLKAGADAAEDRRIDRNALAAPQEGPVKGIRLIESLDFMAYDPLGLTEKKAPPDGLEKEYGNSVIFTQRIWHHYQKLFDQGENRQLKYHTFEDRKWREKIHFTDPTPYYASQSDYLGHEGVIDIVQKGLAFYAAHEAAGHALDLTALEESTNREAYGYHHPEETGTNIDIRIVNKIDKKSTDYNNFYIPISFGVSDKRHMRILSDQP